MLIGKNWIRDFISVRPSLNGSCHLPLNDPNIDIKLLAITSVEFYDEWFPFIYIILKKNNSYGSGQVFDNAVLDSNCKGSSFRLSKKKIPILHDLFKNMFKADYETLAWFVCIFELWCFVKLKELRSNGLHFSK